MYRRFPALQRLVRAGVYWSREMLVPGFAFNPKLLKFAERIARRHLASRSPTPRCARS